MDRTSEMTPEEQIHCDLMRSIARSLSDTPLILKGGTTLLLAYGLNRLVGSSSGDLTQVSIFLTIFPQIPSLLIS